MLLKARLHANQVHLLHDSSHGEQGQCEKQLLYSHPKRSEGVAQRAKAETNNVARNVDNLLIHIR